MIEVYLSQEHINWANENRKAMPHAFDAVTQCPLANALWDHFGQKSELIAVGLSTYSGANTFTPSGSLGAGAMKLVAQWTAGEAIEPGWFTISPDSL